MSLIDQPPPNLPRILIDGELAVNKLRIPVLISAGNHRLIVLQSQAIYDLQFGQQGVLTGTNRPAQDVTIADVDRLALVVRYEPDAVAEGDGNSLEDFTLPSPED
jgi:hypothetical protein